MRDNLVRFPKSNNRPELIDELKVALIGFFQAESPDNDVEKSLVATSVFHFLVASKIALDHLGKWEESALLLRTVRSMEENWPNYQPPLDALLSDLDAARYY